MTLPRSRHIFLALSALSLIEVAATPVWAQSSPSPAPATNPAPQAQPSPDKPAGPDKPVDQAAPAPASSAAPSPNAASSTQPAPAASTPPAADTAAPSNPAPPAATATPAPTAPATAAPVPPPAKVQAADPFGEEITLTARKVIALKGKGAWDSAFETLTESIKTLTNALAKQNIKAAGNTLIVYTSTDDAGFTFQAEIPVDQDPKNLGKDMSVTQSPEGKTLKFVHRGSYDNMDNTYEAITNHLDDKKLEAKDLFIEEYVTDPLKTEEDNLIVNVFVPLK